MNPKTHRNAKTAFFCNPKVQIKQANGRPQTVEATMRRNELSGSDDAMQIW